MKQTAEERAEAKYPNSIKYGLFDSVSNIQFRKVYATCIREEAEPREAEIERLRALVQRFVDHNDKWLGKGCIEADLQWDAIVSDCQEQGFVPTNTTEG